MPSQHPSKERTKEALVAWGLDFINRMGPASARNERRLAKKKAKKAKKGDKGVDR